MARSEARILLIGSDLGQGLSSVAVCRSIGVQYVVCLACGRPGRRGLRIFMPPHDKWAWPHAPWLHGCVASHALR